MADLLIALLELLEAEGRSLRFNLARLLAGLGFVVAGWGLVFLGLGLLLRAFYLHLAAELGPAEAGLVSGFSALAVAGGLLWAGRRLIR